MLQKNFDRPVEWGMIKDYPWSTPQLRKLDVPVCPQPIQYPAMQQCKAELAAVYAGEQSYVLSSVGPCPDAMQP